MKTINVTYKNTSCKVAIPEGAEEIVAAGLVNKVYPGQFGSDFFKKEVETLAEEIKSYNETI